MKFLPITFERIGYADLKKYQKSFKSIVRSKQKGLNQLLRSKVPIESKSNVWSFSGVQASSNIFKSKNNLINPSIMKNFYSLLSISLLSILFALNSGNVMSQLCAHTFYMTDSYGDGWNGNAVSVYVNGVDQTGPQTIASGSNGDFPFLANSGDVITMVWVAGSYQNEVGWSIRDMGSGAVMASGGYGGTSGGYGCDTEPVVPCHGDGPQVDGTTIVIDMVDSYGDSWDGAYIRICLNSTTLADVTVPSGSANSYSFVLSPGDKYALTYVAGSYENEHSYTVLADGIIAFADGPNPIAGNILNGMYAATSIAYDSPNTCYDMSAIPTNWVNGSGGNSWVYGFTSTGSSNTGPTGDADGGNGFYFTEASGIYNTLYRMTGIADFSTSGDPLLTFAYHMYGSGTGTLEVTVDGVSVFSISGNQTDIWRSASIPLDAGTFIDPTAVVIAFEGTTGNNYMSDMCIDNICILDCSAAGSISGTSSACETSTSQLSQSGSSGGTWASDDTGVATVSSNGLVTAGSAGVANITYTIAASGSCPGSVETFAFTSMASPTAGSISGTWWVNIGATTALTQDGTAGGEWTSADAGIATIDISTGVVTGVGAGTVLITYEINAAGCTASSSSINVVVSDNIHIPAAGSITVTTCTGNLYDNGGSAGDYQNDQNGTVVLMPGTPGEKISISGTLNSETGYDEMFVYDGTSTSDTELTPSGGASGTGYAIDYTASNVDGALTVVFISDVSNVDDGFDLAISCVSTCTGTPATATASVSAADDCPTTQGTISATGVASGSGLVHDWETSDNGSSGWVSTGSSNTTVYSTPGSTTYFRYKTTCTSSGQTVYSNVVAKTVATISNGSGTSVCGSGSVDYTATTNSGNVEWYAASSGGSSLGSGTYSPTISSSTIYYAASSACPSTRIAVAGFAYAAPTADAGSDVAHCSGSTSALSGSSIDGAQSVENTTTVGFTDNTTVTSSLILEGSGSLTAASITSVTINATHTYDADLDITLIAPDGSSINLSSDNGGGGDNYTNTVFSSSSLNSITGGTAPFTGVYSPEESFASLSGNAEGGWTLSIYDDAGGDTGSLLEWSIQFTPSTSSNTYSWSPASGLDNENIAAPTTSTTTTGDYTLTVTNPNTGCTAQDIASVTVHENPVAGTVAVTNLSYSGNSDVTEAIEADQITWTNSGTANGDIQYFYEWTDNSGVSPTGAWVAWVTSNPNLWNANSSGANMNRTLWVKTITTSNDGCGTAESVSTWVDVRNCRADVTGATVSAGTVANMPFGETITYDATRIDGLFERFQYQWNSTSGAWSDWGTTDPLSYATDINPGQTLYVRSKIVGASSNGSPTCADYSDPVQTLLIDCANTVSADAGSDDALCDGSTIVISGSGSGSSVVTDYSWSPSTELSSASIASPTVSATTTRTYTLTTTHADGCTATDDVIVTVDVAPAVTSASVTGVSTCGINTYDVELSSLNAGTWSVSPADAVLFDDNTSANTTVTANPVASGFNTDLTLTWTQGAGGCTGSTDDVIVKFNVPIESISEDTETYIWGGLTDTEWTTSSNWYKWDGSRWEIQSASYPGSTSKVYYMTNGNAGVCVSSSNDGIIATSISSLYVSDGATVDLGAQSISLSGDITNNNGTIESGSATITLNGSSVQTIGGSGSPTTNFSNLIIDNSSGVSVDIPFGIEESLTMTSGNINNGSNVITIGTGGHPSYVGSISHASGIITGKLRRYFSNNINTKFFPVGTSSTSRDATIKFNSGPGTDQYLTVEFKSGAPQDSNGDLYNGLPLDLEGTVVQNVSNEGYWEINPTNDDYGTSINSKAFEITLRMNNLTGVDDYSKVRLIKSSGSPTPSLNHTEWSGLTHISATGSNADFTTTASTTGFSFFGGGGGQGNNLPVELVSFNGGCNDGVVYLTWQTASEYNSSHYDVENSRDGITWSIVNTQPAAGNSTELLEYSYTDAHAISGDNYYRLTQVDIDGTEKTYDVINASCTETTSGYFSVFPNPSSGSFQVIMNNSDIIGGAVMNVVDTKGTIVLQKPIEVKTGINMFLVNQELSPGIYYISVKNGNKSTIVLRHSVQ